MKIAEATRLLKVETMACWWTGKYPDWEGILGEVRVLQEGIRARQDIPADASFYTLDSGNPETDMHDLLAEAYLAVIAERRQGHVY